VYKREARTEHVLFAEKNRMTHTIDHDSVSHHGVAKCALVTAAYALALLSLGSYYTYGVFLRKSFHLVMERRSGFRYWANLAGMSHLMAVMLALLAVTCALMSMKRKGGGKFIHAATMCAVLISVLETIAWIVLIS
jgi:hypothetical protein